MIKLLHIADIHIGTKFVNKKESVRRILKKAVMNAFQRSIEFAITEKVDGVLIAGDLFDGGQVPFHGEEGFIRMMTRLEEAKINTFYSTGNHDPYQNNQLFERLRSFDYIHPFYKPVPEVVSVKSQNGESYTVVSAGHDGPKISENVIKNFPVKNTNEPWIGIGHTMVSSINGSVDHGNYMPCSLQDILSKEYDYFALGHIHKTMTLDSEERVRYAGNIQGRHYKETGLKGGWLLEINGEAIKSHFIPFQEVLWREETIRLSEADVTMYDVSQRIVAALSEKIQSHSKWIGRLHLEGETLLHQRLGDAELIEELEENIAEALNALDITIRSNRLNAPIDREELKMGDHFLGAFLKDLEKNPAKIRRYTEDVAFISEKGRRDADHFIEEKLNTIDESLIKMMKK